MKRRRIRTLQAGALLAITTLVGCSASLSSRPVAAQSDSPTAPLPFQDISTSYAQSQIIDLYNRNIVTGDGNHNYRPDSPVTRAEFLTMLDRTFQLKQISDSMQIFQDVPPAHWAYKWIQAGVNVGFVSGKSPITFEPDTSISREEAAAILVRALQSLHIQPSTQSDSFPDMNLVTPWAVTYVNQIHAYQVMNGDSTGFRPQDPISRQEMAVVLDKVLSLLPQQPSNRPITPSIQLAWQYPNTQQTSAFEAEVQASGIINTLSPRWMFLDPNGSNLTIDNSMSDDQKKSLVSWAHANNKQVWPLIGNRFLQAHTNDVLSNASARATLENQIVQFVQTYQLDGINIDFENLQVPSTPQNDWFLAFIRELKTALSITTPNAKLSVDVPPDMRTDWSQPYQYTELSNHADYLVLMGYDEHWSGDSQMGSVSSMPWLTMHLQRLFADGVPSNKLILGLPLYSRDWYVQNGVTNSGDDMTISDEEAMLSQYHAQLAWNNQLGQYTATFHSTYSHTIWVEDSHSLTLKYQLAVNSNVGGVAYWYMGSGTQGIWDGIWNLNHLYSLQVNP